MFSNCPHKYFSVIFLMLITTFCFIPAKHAVSQGLKTRFNRSMTHKLEGRSWLEIKNEGIVKQKKDFSCGSGALATILKHYYNEEIKEADILNWIFEIKDVGADSIKTFDKKVNISFYDLKIFAQKKGYEATGIALSAKALKNLKHPVIVYLDIRGTEHFSVFKGVSDKFVHLADPTFGNIKMRAQRFKKCFDTRDDRSLQGKILGILGDSEINKDFLEIPARTDLVNQLISSRPRMDFE